MCVGVVDWFCGSGFVGVGLVIVELWVVFDLDLLGMVDCLFVVVCWVGWVGGDDLCCNG